MLATELLFVYICCLVDDAIKAGALLIPRRPGPAPACTDAELLTIALVRHLLGRRSESGFLAEIRRDWPHLFPDLPDQPEVNRRTRWLWDAFEQLRSAVRSALSAGVISRRTRKGARRAFPRGRRVVPGAASARGWSAPVRSAPSVLAGNGHHSGP